MAAVSLALQLALLLAVLICIVWPLARFIAGTRTLAGPRRPVMRNLFASWRD